MGSGDPQSAGTEPAVGARTAGPDLLHRLSGSGHDGSHGAAESDSMDPDLVLACRTIDPALLGGRIKEARLRAGLTQTQAAGSRMSTAYVSRIEAGQRRPDPELLQVLADNLGVDVEGLLTGLSRDAATELATRLQWAELSLSTGDAAAALRSVGDVLGEVSASTHESLEREARLLRARALESLGQYDDAIIGYEDLAETAARDLGWVRLMTALSRCHRETGDLARAIDVGDRAAQTIVELDLEGTTEAVQLTLTAAAAYFERGDTGHAARMCRRAVERADQLDTPVARASAYWNASVVESRRGNPRGALDLAREAVGLLDEGSEQRSLARLRTQLGVILLRQDPPLVEEALAALRAAETELATSDASPADLRENHLAQARALFLGGEPDAADF